MGKEKETVCFCFGYSSDDIKQDLLMHGRSLIRERIITASRMGICGCATTHPEKR